MSGLEDEIEQKGKQEMEEKVEGDRGGSQGGGQQQNPASQQQGGDPNAPQGQDDQQGMGDDAQSQGNY